MTAVRRAAAVLGLSALVTGVLPFTSATAAVAPMTLKVNKATWMWTGSAQHPYGTSHPELQYVISQADTPTAETLYAFDVAALRAAGAEVTRLTLVVPASTDPSAGGFDPFNVPDAPADLSALVSDIRACPVTSDWVADPPGRPVDAAIQWDCSKVAFPGAQAPSEAGPTWVFDVTEAAADWINGKAPAQGLVLLPVQGRGTWTVPLIGAQATVVAEFGAATSGPVDVPPLPEVGPTGPVGPDTRPVTSLGGGGGFSPAPGPGVASAAPAPAVAADSPRPALVAAVTAARTVPAGVVAGLLVLTGLLVLAVRELRPSRADVDDEVAL